MGQTQQKQLELLNNDSDIKEILELRSIQNYEKDIAHHLYLYTSKTYPELVEINNFAEHHSAYNMFIKKIKSIDDKIIKIAQSNIININKNSTKSIHVSEFTKIIALVPIVDKEFMFYHNMKIFLDEYKWDEQLFRQFIELCSHIHTNYKSDDLITEQTINKWYEKCDCINITASHLDHLATDYINKLNLRDSKDVINATRELLLNMCKYNLIDGSVTIYYLIKRRNELVEIANNQVTRLLNSLEMLKNDISVDKIIQTHRHKILLNMGHNFNFISDSALRNILQFLYQNLNTPKAKEWLASDGFEKSISDPVTQNTFLNYPQLKQYIEKLDEKSIFDELPLLIRSLRELKYMQKNGLEMWTKRILASRGVGIKQLSFDEGVMLKEENTCIYWFNKYFRSESSKFSDIINMTFTYTNIYELCRVAAENRFERLLDNILDKFGNMLTSQDYFNYIKVLKNTKDATYNFELSCDRNRITTIFKKYWSRYYYNDVYINCSMIDKNKVILQLWNKLPFSHGEDSKIIPPTLDTINDLLSKDRSLYYLCGKRMHLLDEWNKIETFELDNDMNEFGAFKKICIDVIGESNEDSIKKLRSPENPFDIIKKRYKR
jgi:hypothetical protein